MGYQPQPEDLDYPGKLQRRAEKAAAEQPPSPAPAAAAELPVVPDDPEVRSGFCCLHLLLSSVPFSRVIIQCGVARKARVHMTGCMRAQR